MLAPEPNRRQSGLRKYLSLYGSFFKASFIAEMEFRLNFFVRFFVDVVWIIAQIFTFEVLYLHTSLIGHWNLDQTRVFLGVLFVIDALYMTMVATNLDQFSQKVQKGDLDFLLVKPVNSQFIVSFQRVSVANILNLMVGIGWLTWSLMKLPDLSVTRVLWLLLLVPSGFLVVYACRFMFCALAMIFVRADNLQFVFFQLYKMAMRPDGIYFPWLRLVLMTLIPMAMIASVPARAILDPPDLGLMAWALASGPFFVWVSHLFWRRTLRHYASASS